MHDADVSAQERLQTQSLRNVRALVEKLEAEERTRKYSIAVVAAWVLFAVGLLIAGFLAYKAATRPARPAASVQGLPSVPPEQYIDRAVHLIAARANSPGESAGRSTREGRAQLKVTLKQGGYGVVEVAKSSGDSSVDAALAALVKRSEPFGALPAGTPESGFVMALDVQLLRSGAATSELRVARAAP